MSKIKIISIINVLLFTFINASCSTSNNTTKSEIIDTTSESNTSSEQVRHIYYFECIDGTSSVSFDYEHPNYGIVSLDRSSSLVYYFETEQTYELVSQFDTIPIDTFFDINDTEAVNNMTPKIKEGIEIEVSYKYITIKEKYNSAIVHFYVLKDGTLFFIDNLKAFISYSEPNVINYEEFKNKVLQL